MTQKLSDKEKALLIMKKSSEEFRECSKQVRELQSAMYDLQKAFENARWLLKRCLNEEENDENIHKDCEYYNSERDCCYNYLMGCYTGLAFEVSRHNMCIKDMVEDD